MRVAVVSFAPVQSFAQGVMWFLGATMAGGSPVPGRSSIALAKATSENLRYLQHFNDMLERSDRVYVPVVGGCGAEVAAAAVECVVLVVCSVAGALGACAGIRTPFWSTIFAIFLRKVQRRRCTRWGPGHCCLMMQRATHCNRYAFRNACVVDHGLRPRRCSCCLSLTGSLQEMQSLVVEMDSDGNGVIDFDEFCIIMDRLRCGGCLADTRALLCTTCWYRVAVPCPRRQSVEALPPLVTDS